VIKKQEGEMHLLLIESSGPFSLLLSPARKGGRGGRGEGGREKVDVCLRVVFFFCVFFFCLLLAATAA